MAGPITDAVCQVLLRQAIAFWNMLRGMISALSAWRAGWRMPRATPLMKMTT